MLQRPSYFLPSNCMPKITDPVKVIGDKNTNVNLRYKVGKSLSYNKKEVFEITNPKKVGLPLLNLSSTYIFALGN